MNNLKPTQPLGAAERQNSQENNPTSAVSAAGNHREGGPASFPQDLDPPAESVTVTPALSPDIDGAPEVSLGSDDALVPGSRVLLIEDIIPRVLNMKPRLEREVEFKNIFWAAVFGIIETGKETA